jgi:hypothetical protein
MDSVSVLTQDAYDPMTFDAVLVREDTVVCLHPHLDSVDDEETALEGTDVRVVPLENVIHVDGNPGMMVSGDAISEDFFGGAEYGFLDLEQFPEARAE